MGILPWGGAHAINQHIRLFIIDALPVIRDGLSARLSEEPDFVVIGSAGGSEAAIARTGENRPDVVIIDPDLPGLSGVDALRYLWASTGDAGIVVFTANPSDREIRAAVREDVAAFVSKSSSIENLITSIRRVEAGERYFCPAVQTRIISMRRDGLENKDVDSRIGLLTERELSVLRHLSHGLSSREIGAILSISAKTVDNHKSRIMRKLDIHDRVQLSRFALREGIVEL